MVKSNQPGRKGKRRRGQAGGAPDAARSRQSAVPTFSGSGPTLDSRLSRRAGGVSARDFGSRDSKTSGRRRGKRKELGFRDAWVSVQSLGATQLRGWKRRKWEADAFSAIGGGNKLNREQKMPNKMRMGIMRKRKLKLARAKAEELQSDVVTGDQKQGKRPSKSNVKRGKEEDSRDPMASRGVKFKRGVMFVQDIGGGSNTGRRRR